MAPLSSSRGSLHLSSLPFPTLPINSSESDLPYYDQFSTSSSISDASFSSPTTPPSTPPASNWNSLYPAPTGGFGKRRIMRRNSSLSSVNSSIYSEEEDKDAEWTPEEEEKLKRTFETYLANTAATEAPFTGLPPSNLTHVIARAVSSGENRVRTRSSTRARRGSNSAEGGITGEEGIIETKWRHGMKSTRAKILTLVKQHQETTDSEETPRQRDLDADVTPKKRKPMVRQGSMDFLPITRNNAIVARLGSKLHRAEQSGPPASASHPYAHSKRGRPIRTTSLCSLPSILGSPSQPPPPQTSSISQLSSSTSSTRMARTNSDYSGNRDSTGFDSELSQISKNWDQSLLPSSSSSQNSLYNLSFDPTPQKLVVAGLGSAFSTPSVGVGKYPSPISNARKNKVIITPSSSGEFSNDELNPLKRSAKFEDGFLARNEEMGPRKTDGRSKFYLNDNEYSSSGSLSSFGSNNSLVSSTSTSTIPRSASTSSVPFPSTSTSASTSTSMNLSTPSPRAFDFKDLSLGGSVEEGVEVFLDLEYLKAGAEAKMMREQFQSWNWEG